MGGARINKDARLYSKTCYIQVAPFCNSLILSTLTTVRRNYSSTPNVTALQRYSLFFMTKYSKKKFYIYLNKYKDFFRLKVRYKIKCNAVTL